MEIVEEFYIVICFAFFKCFVRLCHCMTPTGGWWCIMWRQMSWEQKGPFLPKLEDGSGSSFFFPPSKKSKKTADTYRRGKYDLWWHHVLPKQICFEEDCFFFLVCCNKETVNHSWRSIGSDSSPSIASTPPPLFPVLWFFRGLNIDVSYRRRF